MIGYALGVADALIAVVPRLYETLYVPKSIRGEKYSIAQNLGTLTSCRTVPGDKWRMCWKLRKCDSQVRVRR